MIAPGQCVSVHLLKKDFQIIFFGYVFHIIVAACQPSCGQNAMCIRGKCQCLPGLQGNPLQKCFDCPNCSPYASCDTEKRKCICRAGYEGNGTTCNRINGKPRENMKLQIKFSNRMFSKMSSRRNLQNRKVFLSFWIQWRRCQFLFQLFEM